MENNKICSICKEINSKEAFYKGHAKCKECRSIIVKEAYRKQHPKNTGKVDTKAKFICECGGSYTYTNKATHMKTKTHI